MGKEKNEIVLGTTCFAEYEKCSISCPQTQCPYWIEHKESYNCVLIAASKGPRTLQQIGDLFGVTRMRICQIEKVVLGKLLNRAKIRHWLD